VIELSIIPIRESYENFKAEKKSTPLPAAFQTDAG